MRSKKKLFEESPKSKKVYTYYNKRTGQFLAPIGLLIVLSIHRLSSTYPIAVLTKKNDVKFDDTINEIQLIRNNGDTRGKLLQILPVGVIYS